MLKLDK
ncbi:hypothetical protein Mgra_00000149 [Meloidogyne graminicola]|nr:hypothetical protein Mgra_00000149 [Meloidogyne graminicola]